MTKLRDPGKINQISKSTGRIGARIGTTGARSAPEENHPLLAQTFIKPAVFRKIGARSAPENQEIGHRASWTSLA